MNKIPVQLEGNTHDKGHNGMWCDFNWEHINNKHKNVSKTWELNDEPQWNNYPQGN